jgi:hypothetical protein
LHPHRTRDLTSIANITADYSSCFNSALSLPVISIFSSPLNQIDIHRKEEPETFHNSKGDIAE